MRKHRWNTIGRTRRKLAEILTAAVQAREDVDWEAGIRDRRWTAEDFPRPIIVVLPEHIHAMRLAGKARIWEDAWSWEAWPKFRDRDLHLASIYSYRLDDRRRSRRRRRVDRQGRGVHPQVKRQLYQRVGEATICGARPLRGDGSLWCTLAPNHKGLHEDEGKAFRRIIPGSSVRSRTRYAAARRRRMR